jgi:hypothetical protein
MALSVPQAALAVAPTADQARPGHARARCSWTRLALRRAGHSFRGRTKLGRPRRRALGDEVMADTRTSSSVRDLPSRVGAHVFALRIELDVLAVPDSTALVPPSRSGERRQGDRRRAPTVSSGECCKPRGSCPRHRPRPDVRGPTRRLLALQRPASCPSSSCSGVLDRMVGQVCEGTDEATPTVDGRLADGAGVNAHGPGAAVLAASVEGDGNVPGHDGAVLIRLQRRAHESCSRPSPR